MFGEGYVYFCGLSKKTWHWKNGFAKLPKWLRYSVNVPANDSCAIWAAGLSTLCSLDQLGIHLQKKTMECKLNFQACYVPKTKCHAKCKMNNHHWIHSYLVPCPSANEICVHHYFFLVKKLKPIAPPSIIWDAKHWQQRISAPCRRIMRHAQTTGGWIHGKTSYMEKNIEHILKTADNQHIIPISNIGHTPETLVKYGLYMANIPQ